MNRLPPDLGLLGCLQSSYWRNPILPRSSPWENPSQHMADKECINLTKWLPAGSGPVLEAGTRGVVLCLAREQPHRSGINHVLLLCHSLGLGRGGVAGRQTAESKGSYFLGFWVHSFVGPLLRAGHLSR